jgi:hypothetical protein
MAAFRSWRRVAVEPEDIWDREICTVIEAWMDTDGDLSNEWLVREMVRLKLGWRNAEGIHITEKGIRYRDYVVSLYDPDYSTTG